MMAATRNEKHIRSASQVLYLALELGVEEWKLAFITDLEAKPRVRTMPARDLKRLVKEVATAMRWSGLPDSTGVRSCYEAGRDGFWLHRHLATVGIDNRVVDSASIEVNRRQRRAKSDGLDARKLVTMLVRYHAGESRVWSVVRIPTVEQEDRRQLHRELRMLKQDRVRVTNRIRIGSEGYWQHRGYGCPKYGTWAPWLKSSVMGWQPAPRRVASPLAAR